MKKLERSAGKVNAEVIGLDVHQAVVVFERLDRRGDRRAGGSFAATREALLEFLGEHVGRRGTHVVLEASGYGEWIYDLLVERYGQERVHVAQARKIRVIARSTEKNDANDAWWLAYLCQEGRLPQAHVPPARYRELRFSTRHRIHLVRARTEAIVRLRSDLARQGERLPTVAFDTEASRERLEALRGRLEGVRRLALDQALRTIDALSEQIEEWDAQVERQSEEVAEVAVLKREMPGVGSTLAAVIAAEAAGLERFGSPKAFGRYTGLTPTDRSTGGRTIHGSITREGSPYLRWALVEAVVHCLHAHRGAGAAVKRWVRAKERRLGHRAKARVAAARKLAEAIWRLFHLGETFDLTKPFGEAARTA